MRSMKLDFSAKGPEEVIVQAIMLYLRAREWFVFRTHGNAYQSGFPDLFCSHHRYGVRLVEVKNPLKYAFTAAQLKVFPQICANGGGVWVMTAATDVEYEKLHKDPNWAFYLSIMKERS